MIGMQPILINFVLFLTKYFVNKKIIPIFKNYYKNKTFNMKTLQINLAIVAALLVTFLNVNAQTNDSKSNTAQRAEEKQKITLLKEIPTTKNASSVSSPSSTTINTNRKSDYFGMEKKIIEWSISGEIPPSLPKHIEGQTEDRYNAILKDWAKNNLNLIKKEYHVQILSDETPVKKAAN